MNPGFLVRFLSAFCVFGVLAAPPAWTQEKGGPFISQDHGFRVEGPDETWIYEEAPTGGQADFVVVIHSAGMGGLVQARVTVNKNAGMDPEARRAALLQYAESTPGISEIESLEFHAVGREWPGMRVVQESSGAGKFKVQQIYMAQGSFLYTLQFHAPVDKFEEHQGTFEKIQKSFAFVEISEDGRQKLKLQQLAAKCGSEADWAADWEEASARAREEGRLVLVYIRSYPGFAMTDEVKAGIFMNTDILELVAERYVPFHFKLHMDAPFKAQSSYGMGPNTFGNSLLLVSPAGEVLSESYGGIPEGAVYDFLLRGLELMDGEDQSAVDKPAEQLELAQWRSRRGQLDLAMKILEGEDSHEAALLRASIHRRHRNGEAAMTELDRAARSGDEAFRLKVEGERAKVLVGLDRVDEAVAIIKPMVDWPDESGAAAKYGMGLVKFTRHDKGAARDLLFRVVNEHEKSRWAWMAAAALTSTYFDVDLGDNEVTPMGWKSEELFESLIIPAAEPWTLRHARHARTEVTSYLLETQREDGSWICPSEIAGNPGEPNHITFAISAICGEALLAQREVPEVKEAVGKAVDYVLATWKQLEADPQPELFMTYSVWSDAYVLSFLGACMQAGVGDADKLKEVMNGVVADLMRRQKSGGGWSYYLTGDLEKAGDPMDISMSFTTAAILLGLQKAEAAGLEVPPELLEKSLGCLERMRNDNGTFEYMVNHGNENSGRNPGERGAAGRGPVCALALQRFGRADEDLIRESLERFSEHRAGLAKERRKALMHCGVGAVGSHYVMFDYFNCAEAIAALPEEDREPFRDMLLTELLGAHNVDGSYLDNPIIGPAFGAGAALLSFNHLQPLPNRESR